MHILSRRLLGLLALVTLVAVIPGSLPAQKDKDEPEKVPELKAHDLAMVAASGCGYVVLSPGELLEHPLARQLPARMRESLQEMEREAPTHVGVSLRRLQRVVVAFPLGGMRQPIVLLGSDKGFSPEGLLKNLGEGWKQDKGNVGPLFHRGGPREIEQVLEYVNESLVLFGRDRDIRAFLDRAADKRPDATLARGLAAAEGGAQLVVGLRRDDLVTILWGRGGAAAAGPATKQATPAPVKDKDDFKKDAPFPPKDKGVSRQPAGDPLSVAYQPDAHEEHRPPTLDEILKEMPAEALPYKPLLQCRAAVLAVKLGDESATASLSLSYGKAEQVEDAQASLRIALYVLREILPRWWLEGIELRRDSVLAVVRALDRLDQALRKVEIRIAGRTVEATATLPTDPATVGVLLREMEFGGFGGFSSERQNNLKQIGIALHAYHDTYDGMPGTAYYSAQGKPGLSWRVAILPYIEQENLYKQFKLDEPWDSEHNKKLLDKMPRIYAPPPGVKAEAGHTFIQGFSGPGTLFDPALDIKQAGACRARLTLAGIPDGTSNTAMVGESGKAVPWTKPDDIPCDGKNVPPLGCVPGSNRCLVLAGDAAIHWITTRPPVDLFVAFTSRSGGEVFNIDDLKPGRRPPEGGATAPDRPATPPRP